MNGTPSQIEWAERIKPQVEAEFDRVARAFEQVMSGQYGADREETQAILAMLREKRAIVLAIPDAGYFIRNWREHDGRVRRMIAEDPAYQAIEANREARKRAPRRLKGES